MYQVRRAKPKDRDAIVALWSELIQLHRELDIRFAPIAKASSIYSDHLKELIASHDAAIFVATKECGGEIIGFIVAEIRQNPPFRVPGVSGYIQDIFVSAEYRNQGLGTSLVDALLNWLRAKKVTSVQLFVSASNPPASTFWQKMGFSNFMQLMTSELPSESE